MLKNTKSKISKPQSLRVLMVEDSQDDALLIIRELKKGGYNPVYERVETAAAMKKALSQNQWDIILCDYKLPGFDGPQAIALLKEANIDIPLIIVSGAIGEEIAVECMRVGAHDYIMKDSLSRLNPAIARELKEAEVRNRQRQAENAMRESEEKYRTILEQMDDSYFEVDLAGNFTFFNDAITRHVGYSREELIGTSFRNQVAKEDIPALYNSFGKIYTTGKPERNIFYSFMHKDGTMGFVDAAVFPLHNSKGEIVGFRGIAREITERRQMEESLRQSEEKYRTILESIGDGYYETDIVGNFTFFNDPMCRILGYSREEMMGMNNRHYTDKEHAKKLFQAFHKVYTTGEPTKEFDWQVIRKDGTKRFIEASVSLRKDSLENPTGFRGIVRDITERKQAGELLRQSEERYRALVENASDIVFGTDEMGHFTFVNQVTLRITGYSEKELIGKHYKLLVRPDKFKEVVAFLVNQYEKRIKSTYYEFPIITKNGEEVWVGENTQLVVEDGRVTGFQAVARDITDRKRAEEERQQSFGRLRKALGATVQSISMIVEMKDPYTAGHQQRVSDLARSIATEMDLPKDQREFIRTASSIHDIGKIALPTEILSKPTKLTDLEFNLIKTHAQSGYDILKDIEFPWPVADVVLQHHERMNGSGYPQGLKGKNILLEARIMAIADVVEAIASHRPYRASLGIDFALEEIEKNKGILYDAAAGDACLRLFREKGYSLRVARSEK